MVLDDGDDKKWVYREHTAAKHEVYRKYLIPWINKLTHYNEVAGRFNKVRVVDCFAGRGSYVRTEDCDSVNLQYLDTPAENPGSPQIILDRLTDRDAEFIEAEAVFIEYNNENFRVLDETIRNTTGVSEKVSIKCIHGSFQDKVLDVVNTDGSDCPTLFFIDPFGFKALNYDVITEIGSTPQFEMLITFMSRDMNRFLEVDFHEESLKGVYGTNEFREKIDSYDPQNWEGLVEYYTDRLEANGPDYTFEYLITEPDTKQTIYYLVFSTNHKNGLHTMREVMHHCGTGNFGYAPKHREHDRSQSGLEAFGGGTNNARQFLKKEFEDYRIEFGNLVEECTERRKYNSDTESDYRAAIKIMEEAGEATVIRLASATNGSGVQRGDLIDFRKTEESNLADV